MDKFLSYASISGRANRARYWLTALAAFAIMFVLVMIMAAIAPGKGSPTSAGGAIAITILILPVLYCVWVMFAAGLRRLHDLDKSAWWALPYFIGPTLIDAVAEFGIGRAATAPYWAVKLAGMALSLWVLVEVGFFKGTAGPNRFGPDPLAAQETPAGLEPA